MNVIVRGRPGGRLQFSRGGPKMAWLASAFSSIRARCPKKVRRWDLMMDESGWLVGNATNVGISDKVAPASKYTMRQLIYVHLFLIFERNC